MSDVATTKPDWKAMAAQSSRSAAFSTELLRNLMETGRALADKLPAHWHDNATVEFIDALQAAENAVARQRRAAIAKAEDQ